MFRVGVLAIWALVWNVGARAEQIPGYSQRLGAWEIGAYTSDSKMFSHCAMYAAYQSGISMILTISRDFSWRIAWMNEKWNLKQNQAIQVALYIDGVGPQVINATARQPNLVVAELPDSATLFDSFRKGYKLVAHAEGSKYEFSLNGTYNALTETVRCVRQFAEYGQQSAGSSNKASGSTSVVQPQNAPREDVELKLEATTLMGNILSMADIANARILTSQERKSDAFKDLVSWEVVWRADSIVGGLLVPATTGKTNFEEVTSALIAGDKASCGSGAFLPGSAAGEDGRSIASLVTSCTTGGKTLEVWYVLAPRESGGYYQFVTFGYIDRSSDNTPLAKADALLRTAVKKSMKWKSD